MINGKRMAAAADGASDDEDSTDITDDEVTTFYKKIAPGVRERARNLEKRL
jgi:hypothetical protein